MPLGAKAVRRDEEIGSDKDIRNTTPTIRPRGPVEIRLQPIGRGQQPGPPGAVTPLWLTKGRIPKSRSKFRRYLGECSLVSGLDSRRLRYQGEYSENVSSSSPQSISAITKSTLRCISALACQYCNMQIAQGPLGNFAKCKKMKLQRVS